MVRPHVARGPARSRSPHVRGDGPNSNRHLHRMDMFSPRAWGWSGYQCLKPNSPVVLPTCVGMVRLARRRWHHPRRSPHVRGDGPLLRSAADQFWGFSPRAWGWSEAARALDLLAGVLPTCVGMVRLDISASPPFARSPHVRGDGPKTVPTVQVRVGFSPRAWGWSGVPCSIPAFQTVLPTCVGMVRRLRRPSGAAARSPHVRGDGPPTMESASIGT